MRIGYPCINLTVECKGNRTFRLKSYSEERLIRTARDNLDCLFAILRYNVENNILFFRITSDLVPFASHPICDFDWLSYFEQDFKKIGNYITAHNIRISMHPGQYTILNSPNENVLEAKLEDAEFFYNEDTKTKLEDKVEKLKKVTFLGKLGTLFEKTERLMVLGRELAFDLRLPEEELKNLERAAWLCKADLETQMVYEFPNLQGFVSAL